MKFNEIGFDFSNLQYGVIKKKNLLAPLILLILSVTFLLIMIPFLLLWFFEVPIEINGVMRESSEIEYQNFMKIFLSIFGFLTIGQILILIYFYKRNPREYIIISKDLNLDSYYRIKLSNTLYLYIFPDQAMYYDESNNSLRKINDYKEKQALEKKYIFWDRWNNIEDYQIKKNNKKTVLIFDDKNNRTALRYRYTFSLTNNLIPKKITEIVSSRTSNNTMNSINVYYFIDINRLASLRLPQEIIKLVEKEY